MDSFTIIKNNKPVKYDILLTFKDDNTNKNYMIYTDYQTNQKKEILIYSAIYNPDNLNELQEITDEKELKEIEKVIKMVKEQIKSNG